MEAERLPNSPHGLNSYRHYHNVVVLSAFNPTPAHFSFLKARQVDGDEVRDAHYHSAVYQAVCVARRDQKDDREKKIVVMDRSTADWLADLFPGAKVEPLGGKALGKLKGKPGRRRLYENDAERVAAHRAKQEQDWLRQLAAINDASLGNDDYPDLNGAMSASDASTNSCNENTLYRGDIVTRRPTERCLARSPTRTRSVTTHMTEKTSSLLSCASSMNACSMQRTRPV